MRQPVEDLMCSRSRAVSVSGKLLGVVGVVAALAAALAGCAAADNLDGSSGQLEVGHPSSGPFSAVSPSTWATATWPQGANFVTGEGSNLKVGVYAAHATRVLLEIYASPTGAGAQFDYVMTKGSDGIWRAQVASVPGKTLYAFRAWGPNWTFSSSWAPGSSAGFVTDVDASGNRYNPNKVLPDPYGRELSHDKTAPALIAAGLDGGAYGTGGATYHGVARRAFDTGPWAPKSIALATTSTGTGTRPAIAPRDQIVYEAHVRGLTAHTSAMSLTTLLAGIPGFSGVVNVPSGCRGTYQAAGLMAPYLQGLGVNVIELLPVHESDNDTIPLDHAGGNYWGYVTDGFFAPDRHYACDRSPGGPTAEFKAMVKAFHDRGIEVWLDVVYNHTGEGGNWDATEQVAEVSGLRGFDNIDFYQLPAGDKAAYFETTGVGNNLNVATAAGRRLVLDSLKYWGTQLGVDGFRFDLACELGRDAAPGYGFNPGAQLYQDIASFAQASSLDVIAEPWDIGAYGVGQFPSGWGEWNGKYRDASRRFFRGDLSGANGASYADAFYGDFNDYSDQGGAAKSVNFLVAHDGFTLADLVSYGGKTNTARAWPFGPSDGGSDSNDSWDSDGDHALRRQRFRSLLTWELLSRGTPMLVAGDEFARTQNGNNNPYNVDAPGTWNNYGMIATDAPQATATGVSGEAYHNNFATDAHADGKSAVFQFARQLINLRRTSRALRQGDYAMSISFARNDGSGGFDAHSDRAVRIQLDGSSVGDADYLLYVNNWSGTVTFTPPAPDAGKHWARIIDTAAWAESHDNFWSDAEADAISGAYDAHAWSIVVLKAL
jgi:glycogen operon protein